LILAVGALACAFEEFVVEVVIEVATVAFKEVVCGIAGGPFTASVLPTYTTLIVSILA